MSDPDPTPAEELVRRLLADARHDEPMPADIADRLDGVLAGLQDESRRTPAPVDLSARRRRRIARNVLVAAAAVVVLGVGISRVDLSGRGDADGGSADSGAASASGAREDGAAGGDTAQDLDRLVRGRPLLLSSADFDRQVSRLRAGHTLTSLPRGRTWCNDPAWGAGERIPVRYDEKRGVLVLRPPTDGSRVVDLYLCGEALPTRSTTVSAD